MPRGERVEGLPRRHRFTSRGSFGPVLKDGRKIRGRKAVLHVALAADGVSRLGVGLTRKLVRLAVNRNRLKRAIRETFRRHRAKRLGVECVVMLRERVDGPSIGEVVEEVASLLDRVVPPSSP
jgi:ribonuclease P protein component